MLWAALAASADVVSMLERSSVGEPRSSGVFNLVIGIIVILVAIFSDRLGLGDVPGFGRAQVLGALIGGILILMGLVRLIRTMIGRDS